MKTTTAIQKSREELRSLTDLGIDYSKDMSKEQHFQNISTHITTSQKYILSALIEDIEGERKAIPKIKDYTFKSMHEAEWRTTNGFNKAITKVQDVIRKAIEV